MEVLKKARLVKGFFSSSVHYADPNDEKRKHTLMNMIHTVVIVYFFMSPFFISYTKRQNRFHVDN